VGSVLEQGRIFLRVTSIHCKAMVAMAAQGDALNTWSMSKRDTMDIYIYIYINKGVVLYTELCE
jgi:hypothetical protein